MNEYTYEVLTSVEGDPTASLVRKAGITAEFTVAELMKEERTYRRYLKEGEGQLRIERMKMDNYLTHHPKLKKLPPEDLFAAALYEEARKKSEDLERQMGNIRAELDLVTATEREIEEQLGIKIPTAEEIVDDAVAKIVEPEEEDEADTDTAHA